MLFRSAIFVLCFVVGHATPSAANPAPSILRETEKMIRDVDHIVQVAEQANWHIDREEIRALRTDILLVICPADIKLRQAALHTLESRSTAHGDIKSLFEKSDGDLNALALPLRHHRSLLLYQSGLANAEKDCPFWLKANESYTEKHRPTEQFILGFDGGGMFNVTPASSPLRFGFGGSSRLSGGYGLSERYVLRFGFEFGGAGLLDKDIEVDNVDVQFFAGLPIALRFLWDIWFLEGDVGPVALGIPWKQTPELGGRLSAMFGFASAKLSDFQPWAGVRVSTDYLPNLGLNSGLVIRTGIRFGVDYRGL